MLTKSNLIALYEAMNQKTLLKEYESEYLSKENKELIEKQIAARKATGNWRFN